MGELWVDHVSFSQLSSTEECPYQNYLLRIAGVEPVPNAFAEAGTLAHKLLAGWAKGEITLKELPVQWIERFPKEVKTTFPPYLASKNYAGRLFEAILDFFETFDGFDGYEIVAAEQEFVSALAGEKFVGIIDLVLRSKKTGGLTVLDYKSCSLSSFRKNRDQMYRQLALYSKFCADRYGEFPEMLRFELIKESAHDERRFDRKEFVEACSWAAFVIQRMRNMDLCDLFTVKPEFFRCTNLCACRNECLCGKPEYYRKDDKNETKCFFAVVRNSARNP